MNEAGTTFSPERTAVVVIDLQHEFIGDEAVFPIPGGERIAEESNSFVKEARGLGANVFFTLFAVPDAQPVGRSTERFGNPLAHRYPGARLLASLDIDSRDIVLEKSRQSAFVGTNLELLLRRKQVRHVVIIGVTTHSCCLATAIDAAARDFEVTVLSDLTAAPAVRRQGALPGMTPEQAHIAALQLIGYSSGRVATAAEILEELKQEVAPR